MNTKIESPLFAIREATSIRRPPDESEWHLSAAFRAAAYYEVVSMGLSETQVSSDFTGTRLVGLPVTVDSSVPRGYAELRHDNRVLASIGPFYSPGAEKRYDAREERAASRCIELAQRHSDHSEHEHAVRYGCVDEIISDIRKEFGLENR